MKERPILFNGEMVRAVLEGRKTQTRRVVKPQPPKWSWTSVAEYARAKGLNLKLPTGKWVKAAYGKPGDRLWVRETFAIESNYNYGDVYDRPDNPLGPVRWGEEEGMGNCFECPRYRASEPETILGDDEDGMRWKPSIFMPRWASRITLEVTDVRVERVQEISETDAVAESCQASGGIVSGPMEPEERDGHTAAEEFKALWDSINEKRGFGWEKNPWVWVVEFKKI